MAEGEFCPKIINLPAHEKIILPLLLIIFFAAQWSSSGTIFKKHYSRRTKTLSYGLNTFGGNSGSPVWIDDVHSKKVIALHGYGHLGITIHPRMIADLRAWGVPLRG